MSKQTFIPRRGGRIELVTSELTVDGDVWFPDDIYAIFGDDLDFKIGYWGVVNAGVISLPASGTRFGVASLAGGLYFPLIIEYNDAEFGERMLDQSSNESVKVPVKIRVAAGGTLNDGILLSLAAINSFGVHLNSSNTGQFRLDGGTDLTRFDINLYDDLVQFNATHQGTGTEASLAFTCNQDLTFVCGSSGTGSHVLIEGTGSDLNLFFNRSSHLAPSDNDDIATINLSSDASAAAAQQRKVGAAIKAVADDDWSTLANDYPTRLEFYTQSNAGGDGTAKPHVVIDSTGVTKIGDGANADYAALASDGSLSLHGTARIDWAKITADNMTQNVNDGNEVGTVADIQTARDTNVYLMPEVGAAPGVDIEVEFVSVTAFNWVNILAQYEGSTGHDLTIQLYNFSTTRWETFSGLPAMAYSVAGTDYSFCNADFFVPDDTNFIGTAGDAGDVRVRFVHIANGNAAHNLYIDVVALYQ